MKKLFAILLMALGLISLGAPAPAIALDNSIDAAESLYGRIGIGDVVGTSDSPEERMTITGTQGTASIWQPASSNSIRWSINMIPTFGSFEFNGMVTIYAVDDYTATETFFTSYPVSGAGGAGSTVPGVNSPFLPAGITFRAYLSGTCYGSNGGIATVMPGVYTQVRYS